MGQLLSRVRKKQSTDDVLKELEKELQALEERRRTTEQKKKRLLGTLIFYSILLYSTAVVLIYFYWYSSNYQRRLIFAIPMVIFPFLMWGLKLFLQWLFQRSLESNLVKLTELHKKKRSILNDVKENETYSKAKEILEKYDPEFKKQLQIEKEAAQRAEEIKMLRRRSLGPMTGNKMKPQPQQNINNRTQTPGRPPNMPPLPNNGQFQMMRPPGPPLPRPILPRETGVVDKFIDYIIGDGPSNRYALICQQCFSHNGMALKEEFEYIAFRCCYCYALNPAKKLRPFAPRLPMLEPPPPPPSSSKPSENTPENVTSTVNEEGSQKDVTSDDEFAAKTSFETGVIEEEEEQQLSKTNPFEESDLLNQLDKDLNEMVEVVEGEDENEDESNKKDQ